VSAASTGSTRVDGPRAADGLPNATLVWDKQPDDAAAVVLVMHGGAMDGLEPNRPWSHNVARLVPFAWSLRRLPAPLAVARLRFRVRGWNGDAMPVHDARWALERLREAYPGRPLALVGHSMGGRVALHVGAAPDVRLVVGLAPWIEPGDPRPGPGQRTVLFHGDRDVVCGLSRSRTLVEAMQEDGLDASLVRVERGDHAMLVRPRLWTRLVTETVTATFADDLGVPVEPPSGPLGAVVAQVVHGRGVVLDV
jgi:acetyl esterase/lipase